MVEGMCTKEKVEEVRQRRKVLKVHKMCQTCFPCVVATGGRLIKIPILLRLSSSAESCDRRLLTEDVARESFRESRSMDVSGMSALAMAQIGRQLKPKIATTMSGSANLQDFELMAHHVTTCSVVFGACRVLNPGP